MNFNRVNFQHEVLARCYAILLKKEELKLASLANGY